MQSRPVFSIREATSGDLVDCVDLLRKFSDESGTTRLLGFDEEVVFWRLQGASVNPDYLINVLTVDDVVEGICVGFVVQSLTSMVTQGTEIAWYVNKEFRGSSYSIRLMKKLEEWARGKGANCLSMVSLENLSPEISESIYSKLGYSKVETTFVKVL